MHGVCNKVQLVNLVSFCNSWLVLEPVYHVLARKSSQKKEGTQAGHFLEQDISQPLHLVHKIL